MAGVSRSGYYKWLKYADTQEKDYGDYMLIKELFDKGKAKYGWRTLQMKLKSDQDVIMNHKKIIRIMHKYHLVTKIRRRNPYKVIMRITQTHKTFRNKLNRKFQQTNPYRTFCTDITFLPFKSSMVYLSAVKDIATREIVAWNLSQNLSTDISLDTINNMEKNHSIPSLEDAMIHSDQGGHYTNSEYIERIKELQMIQSMSRKGNAVDNAPIESFFGHFKDDIDYAGCKTFEEVKLVTDRYIEYYNNKRQQWHLKKMTPVQYRNHLLLKRR